MSDSSPRDEPCPTAENLEAYLRAHAVMTPIAQHVRACRRCRSKLSELRGQAALLSEVRKAARDGEVDEALRDRLVDICRRAEADSNSGTEAESS